jgi:hypothetical protein
MNFRALCLAMSLGAGLAATAAAQGAKQLTPADLRPPADVMVDCVANSPPEAVVGLKPPIGNWATIYCTKTGAVFSANDRYVAVFPEGNAVVKKGQRALFAAAAIEGKPADYKPESPKDAPYFKGVRYYELNAASLETIYQSDPLARTIVAGRPAWRLELKTNGDGQLFFLVLDPGADPFWVFPFTDKGLGQPAFMVMSLNQANKTQK